MTEGKSAWFESSTRSPPPSGSLRQRKFRDPVGYTYLRSSQSYRRRWSWSINSTNVTYTEGERRLIRHDEVMHDLRTDAQIVVPRYGHHGLRSRHRFRRPEIAARPRRTASQTRGQQQWQIPTLKSGCALEVRMPCRRTPGKPVLYEAAQQQQSINTEAETKRPYRERNH